MKKITMPLFILVAFVVYNAVYAQRASMQTLTALKPDDGMSSSTHSKYIRKLVFANTEIVKGQVNESAFKNQFTLKDDIYGRVYLEHSLANESRKNQKTFTMGGEWHMFIDGKEVVIFSPPLDEKAHDMWTTWQVVLSPNTSDTYDYGQTAKNYWENVYRLPAGSHTVKMVYRFRDDGFKDIAVGEFTLMINEEDRKTFIETKCAKLPAPGMKDAALESELLAEMQGKFKGQTPIKVVIMSKDWGYNRHKVSGVIISRTISAGVALKYDDGSCHFVEFLFDQQNQGGTTYGKSAFGGTNLSGKNFIIPCDNVK